MYEYGNWQSQALRWKLPAFPNTSDVLFFRSTERPPLPARLQVSPFGALKPKSGCVFPYSLSFFEQLGAEEDKALEEGKSAGEKEPGSLSDSMEQSLSAPSPSIRLHWAML